MDKTLQTLDNSLSQLIEGTQEKGAKLIDFLYEQAPEVISQLLMWKGVESFSLFVVGVVVVVGGLIFNYFAAKQWLSYCDEKDLDGPDKFMPIFMGTIFIQPVLQVIGWLKINLIWLKIYLAPKVFLLEYITNNI